MAAKAPLALIHCALGKAAMWRPFLNALDASVSPLLIELPGHGLAEDYDESRDFSDQAVELANKSNYGLGACLYTRDLSEAIRATERLQAGMVWVNAPLLDNDAGPFGGTKSSGFGRQLGPEGLETFRQTKMVMIDPDCQPQDFWWFPYDDKEAYPGGDA